MAGQRVLELGFGPGYDALACMQNGADYRGIDITPENVERTRKHLAFYGYEPKVELGDAENLPFEDESFDIVFSNGVLHHTPDIMRTFAEAHRVLRKGGSFYVILYHKNSIFYRVSSVLSALAARRPVGERLRYVEANAAGEAPIVNVYSRREVSRMLAAAAFSVRSIKVRKLTWEDLPLAGRTLGPLYRCVPGPVYRTLGRAFGWYVIGHGVK
jgi:ubiquinone/menaquinone biosynthesis C-methylase UbiE